VFFSNLLLLIRNYKCVELVASRAACLGTLTRLARGGLTRTYASMHVQVHIQVRANAPELLLTLDDITRYAWHTRQVLLYHLDTCSAGTTTSCSCRVSTFELQTRQRFLEIRGRLVRAYRHVVGIQVC
jgi:hypothetical protein